MQSTAPEEREWARRESAQRTSKPITAAIAQLFRLAPCSQVRRKRANDAAMPCRSRDGVLDDHAPVEPAQRSVHGCSGLSRRRSEVHGPQATPESQRLSARGGRLGLSEST